MFLDYLGDRCIAYDIDPEDNRVVEQDFLELDLDYKKGRCIIGNPPFGSRMYIAQQFFKKSTQMSDYISFILPISQLWNNNSLYEFDLIHSEDLDKRYYSDRKLHCCFNIYRRPFNGLNKKPKNKLKDVTIIREDSKKYNQIKEYDLRMCYWGDGSAGKILKEDEKYSGEYKIVINNENIKDNIISVLKNVDWWEELNAIAMLRIKQYHIIQVLQNYVPEIE